MKIVLLLSGGLHSGVALAEAVNRTTAADVHAVHVYTDRNAAGTQAARELCREYSVTSTFLPFPKAKRLLPGAYRQGLILALAVGIAESIGAPQVWTGHHGAQAPATPDDRPEYRDGLAYAVHAGTTDGIKLHAPFAAYTPEQVVQIGLRLEFPFDLTWSCEGDGLAQCGACLPCVRRRDAFARAEVDDPTEYEVAACTGS